MSARAQFHNKKRAIHMQFVQFPVSEGMVFKTILLNMRLQFMPQMRSHENPRKGAVKDISHSLNKEE